MRGRRAALLSSEIREQSGIKNSAANSISPGARAISPGFPGQAGRGGGDCVCGGEVKASFVNFVFVEENIRCYLCLPPASLGFFPSLCCHVRRTPTHSSIPPPRVTLFDAVNGSRRSYTHPLASHARDSHK
jgi:hypothetical protein